MTKEEKRQVRRQLILDGALADMAEKLVDDGGYKSIPELARTLIRREHDKKYKDE